MQYQSLRRLTLGLTQGLCWLVGGVRQPDQKERQQPVGLAFAFGAAIFAAGLSPAGFVLAAVPVEEQSTSRGSPVPAPASPASTVTRTADAASAVPKQTTQLFFELQTLRAELERLQGVTEEQAHEIERLRRAQREQYVDLDARLTAALGASNRANPPADAVSNDEVRVVDGVVVDGVVVDGVAPRATANQPAGRIGSNQSEKKRYNAAFDLRKNREFSGSIAAFQALLSDYPNGDYAANARYWLGELYLLGDNLDAAKSQFELVIEGFPAHQKVPDSLYKLGVVNHRSGAIERALAYFDDVLNRYPHEPAAGLAQSYAAELR